MCKPSQFLHRKFVWYRALVSQTAKPPLLDAPLLPDPDIKLFHLDWVPGARQADLIKIDYYRSKI